ncbi:restriction endonuclease subunit S [Polynucleobacter sp. MG-27-Goln-C1]|uniref:restriction endonuclease subunit S n=1 Tax=Polynucleobacter sp. MG-27-Goln-C1 TaxID=1819726 RepID=UPI001C0DD018|nr:restriction endonuclease subunit S [Polynucleobacter sp. MG-27-Goln-C1]MBU3612038.1 restriction endonuclease subunit S [Polynucleobacter sp. MG-27-Goln-C1]
MTAPKLRFKSFHQQYQECELASLGEIQRGRFTPRPRNDPKYFIGGNIPFVQTGDIVNAPLYVEKYTQFLNEEGLAVSKQFPACTVFITIAANIGDTAIAKEPVACTDSVVAIKTYSNKADPFWLKYFLDTRKGELDSKATQNAQKNINLQVLRPLKVAAPVIEEQQKVGLFLSKIDQKISGLTKKHELLIQYKNGVMQKIFNQEIRFKDSAGKDFPGWEYVPLEEVLDYEQPGRYLVSSTEYSDGFDTPVLTAGKTFLLGYTDEINGIYTDLPVIIFDDFTTAFKFVDFPFKAKSSAMKMLKNINSDNCLRYIYEAMCRIDFQGGDEHKRYWISQYSKITIPLPHHDEQIKILEFSVGIDKKIEIIKSKLELTKQYKQGLLQQMFI